MSTELHCSNWISAPEIYWPIRFDWCIIGTRLPHFLSKFGKLNQRTEYTLYCANNTKGNFRSIKTRIPQSVREDQGGWGNGKVVSGHSRPQIRALLFCVVYVVKKVKGLESRMVSGDSEYHMRGHCISGGKRGKPDLCAGCVCILVENE